MASQALLSVSQACWEPSLVSWHRGDVQGTAADSLMLIPTLPPVQSKEGSRACCEGAQHNKAFSSKTCRWENAFKVQLPAAVLSTRLCRAPALLQQLQCSPVLLGARAGSLFCRACGCPILPGCGGRTGPTLGRQMSLKCSATV